jgi:hypothetical protein
MMMEVRRTIAELCKATGRVSLHMQIWCEGENAAIDKASTSVADPKLGAHQDDDDQTRPGSTAQAQDGSCLEPPSPSLALA